jgi:hypothetical protein
MFCPILECGASCLNSYRKVYRPLPPGGKQNAVNKYIIKKSVYDLKPWLFNYTPIRLKIEIT